jgi:hypothetical protein
MKAQSLGATRKSLRRSTSVGRLPRVGSRPVTGGVGSWSAPGATNKVAYRPHISVGRNSEAFPMWLDIQPWLPLLTIGLTITICFGIVSIMKGLSHAKW